MNIGTVMTNASIEQDGTFLVSFGLKDSVGEVVLEQVTYVSPYGNSGSGFIAIPTPGSLVLCTKIEAHEGSGRDNAGWYYIGSIMGKGTTPEPDEDSVSEGRVSDGTVWPRRFKSMYEATELYPDQIGMTNARGDNFSMFSRHRPEGFVGGQMQDYRIQMQSGSGKSIRLVDTPEVDGIIMSNEHVGKDYFIFSSSNSTRGSFSEGEWFLRTHGPVNMYTTASNMRYWVQEGHNLQLENLASGEYGYKKGGISPNAKVDNTAAAASSRITDVGNETWGCVELRSANNNVILEALAEDSVIRIEAPGSKTKIIINTGGTVDIVAKKKITLQSDEEIELNAPKIDINGSTDVHIDGGTVALNLPDSPPEL
tara:strand:+ start:14463 stop:15566 length:1104 start_codon:yes stop_codon:yes gene_type:complete